MLICAGKWNNLTSLADYFHMFFRKYGFEIQWIG